MAGIYVHVPFCSSRCIYCDFYSTTSGVEMRTAYVEALCRELAVRCGELSGHEVQTLYFGGGTPSLLSLEQLAVVMETIRTHYQVSPSAEITLESNPDDVTVEKAEGWKKLGFNRVSLGIQTFHDDILRVLRRRHTAADACRAVHTLYEIGITNLTVDLIYGLPGQDLERWKVDVEQIATLPVQHLSAYALSYEEGTVLTRMRDAGTLEEADEELLRKMYVYLLERTAAMGFEHYEISNFCRPGYASRHNSSYWHGIPYLGVGPGAHSYDGKSCRRANLPDLKAYVAAVGQDKTVPCQNENLDEVLLFEEYLLTALRTMEGISLSHVSARFGTVLLSELMKLAVSHIRKGSLEVVDDHLRLTLDGIFISDYILSDLIAAADEE